MSHGNGPRKDSGVTPEDAAFDIRRILIANREAHRETSRARSVGNAILEWAREYDRLLNPEEWIGEFYKGGMEHDILLRPSDQSVIKITLPGEFGRAPRFRDGFISMLPAAPLFYLDRLQLSNELFADDWRVLGVVIDSGLLRFVVSQPLVVGEKPTQNEVDCYMSALGFMRIGVEHAYRHQQRHLVVTDTHLGNYLRGPQGQIYAIDVIPKQCDRASWEEVLRMQPNP